MNKKELENYISHIIHRVKNKEQVEENKIELKSEWYNFQENDKKKQIVCEFLKDITAIANTPGPTGYLIIGINEKTGVLKDSQFKNCGLQDISELYSLIVKYIDSTFDFEYLEIKVSDDSNSYNMGVFIVPPSLSKPHVIGYYLSKKNKEIINYIPIKKSTGIFTANRSDIEFMYYDRKNIEPEYALEIKSYNPRLAVNSLRNELKINFQLCFSNFGYKPIILVEIFLIINDIMQKEDLVLPNSIMLNLENYDPNFTPISRGYDLSSHFMKIPSNSVETVYSYFKLNIHEDYARELTKYLREPNNKYSLEVEAIDINGKKYSSLINQNK